MRSLNFIVPSTTVAFTAFRFGKLPLPRQDASLSSLSSGNTSTYSSTTTIPRRLTPYDLQRLFPKARLQSKLYSSETLDR